MAAEWKIGDFMPDPDTGKGRWEIYKILKGGMGIVYVVYDHDLREAFAAKTYQEEIFAQSPHIADRFRKEAITWVNLDVHQNITQAHYVRNIKGKPFLFLEYVSGGDLSKWISTQRLKHNLAQVLRFAIQFCDGMTHAIAKGIKAHRDIKPQNCLITEDRTLKVTDFGLAKVFDDANLEQFGQSSPNVDGLCIGQSRTGTAAGTCTHMAPEQFDDAKHVDVRADIYSFGIMLYQMVTGQLPFIGRNWNEFEYLHKTQPPPLLNTDHLPLTTFIRTCLAKDPSDRFEDFSTLREKLSEEYKLLTGEPAPQPIIGEACLGWINKGLSLRELGKTQEALACLDQALQINQDDESAWVNKGLILMDLGRTEEALLCCDQALEIDPHDSRLWVNKIAVLERLGKAEEALLCCEHALETNPQDAMLWINKGTVLQKLGKAEEALASYDRAIDINPYDARSWYNKSDTLRDLGRPQEAIVCCDRALEIEPHDADAWNIKGAVLQQLGKTEEALACYDKGLQIESHNVILWINKGLVLNRLGKAEEGLACLDRALEIDPNDARAWYYKALNFIVLKRFWKAFSCFYRALNLDPYSCLRKFKDYKS